VVTALVLAASRRSVSAASSRADPSATRNVRVCGDEQGRGDPVVRDLRSYRGADAEVRRGFVTACIRFQQRDGGFSGINVVAALVYQASLPLGESSRSYTRRAHASDVVATTTTAYLRIRKTRLVLAACEQAGRLESLATLLERHQRALR
jgi:hypothetical protein